MFCPKCGHQQVSDEMRFCSRCGFQLAGVTELLANDGVTPSTASSWGLQKRPRVSRMGAKMMFFSVILAPIFLVLSFAFDHPAPLFVSLALFLAGLAQIVYKRIFSENLLPGTTRQKEIPASDADIYLPPPRPMTFDTSDLAAPPSITEPSTRLLHDVKKGEKRTT